MALAEGTRPAARPALRRAQRRLRPRGHRGRLKLYAEAREVKEPAARQRYRETIKARIDWEPEEPTFHLFALDVGSAGFVIFGTDRYGLAWDPERGLRRWKIPPD